MIVDLPDTTTSAISKALVKLREEGGAVALGRVLTLVISSAGRTDEGAIEAANEASREHPMRVIVLSTEPETPTRLDAQIRIGGDAGASEVVVLHACGEAAENAESLVTGLLLPDAPVVVWWPGEAPEDPHLSPLGRIGTRRITDAASSPDPVAAIERLGEHYTPGDTDFSWTRLTLWRAQLAAVLDQPPFEPVTGVTVVGSSDSPSTYLLALWLELQLQVDVERIIKQPGDGPNGIHLVRFERASGPIELSRDYGGVAVLTQPNQPVHEIALPRRSLRDCLAEELRRLDPDELFGRVVRAKEGSR